MNPELFWIPGPWRGRLALARRPRGGDWLEDEVIGWKQAGLHVIISLLESEEAAQLELELEKELAEASDLQFISFPIPDRGIPGSMEDALRLLRDIAAALDEGKNVAVHCRQGLGRSGMIAAGVLVRSGIGPQDAVDAVSAARGQSVPETLPQHRWIQQLPSEPLVVAS